MKKILVLMVLWYLLGQMPAEEWNKIPNTDAYIKGITNTFSEENKCDGETKVIKATKAIGDEKTVLIFGRCREPGEKTEEDSEIQLWIPIK